MQNARLLEVLSMRTALLVSITIIRSVACHDATSPAVPVQRNIYAIQVPQHAALTDTIRIAFQDGVGYCDTGAVVESQLMAAGVRFFVSSVPTGGFCPPGVYVRFAFMYTVVPPHPVPFTVLFAEPGEADSVGSVRFWDTTDSVRVVALP